MRLLPLLLCLIVFTCVRAQDNYTEKRRNEVIALNGLNFRDAPGLDGKIIDKLPFGTSVEIISDTSYALDDPEHLNGISHFWVKARYNGQVGFLYDAYLAFPLSDDSFFFEYPGHKNVNTDYRLFRTDGYLDEPLPNLREYHWYGLFQEAGQVRIKAVAPEYQYQMDELNEGIILHVSQPKQPFFLLACKKPIPTGIRKGVLYDWGNSPYATREKDRLAAFKKAGIEVAPSNSIDINGQESFLLHRGKTTQALAPPAPISHPHELVATGDFNGDGQEDLIVSHWHEHYDTTLVYTLYLGQPAGSDTPVVPVALFFQYVGC
jgi:hypothetical protein